MGWQDAPIVKPAGPAQAKQPWEDAPIVKPAAQQEKTLAQAAFPSASALASQTQVQTPLSMGFGQSGNVGGANVRGISDLASLSTRAAGATAGKLGYTGATGGAKSFKEGLADPETGLARPIREAYGNRIKEQIAGLKSPDRNLFQKAGNALGLGADALGYAGASLIEDPAVLVGGAAKLAPKAVGRMAERTISPITGGASKLAEKTANLAEAGANKIQNTIIRPRQVDEVSGFKIGNVAKHDVQGSLEEVIGKSQAKIEESAKSMKALIKQGKDNGARVDLNKAVYEVEKEISGNKAKEFASLRESPGALKDLKARIRLMAEDAPRGKVDLVDAQYVKQALGDMGAFEHVAGKQGATISKEDRALSQIASRVYLKLKDQIEAVAPEGVKELNQTMSELIPVNRAAMYRKLVADRNNVVSMSDMLGAMATIGGGPQGLALWAASRATKSGNTAKALYGAAKALRSARAPGEAEFYANSLQRMGVAASEIEAIRGAAEAAQSNVIPFRMKDAAENEDDKPVYARGR